MDTLRHHKAQLPTPPVYRYDGERRFSGTISPRGGKRATPVTLLIPDELFPALLEKLESFPRRHGAYLRVLLRRYRQRCIEGGLLQSGCVKQQYQKAGLHQRRFSMRVNDEAWLELGVWADFLGVSRCLLFVLLLELDLHEGPREAFVGSPTNKLQAYDIQMPGYLEFSVQIYIFRNHHRRILHLRPRPPDELPNDLRLICKYPQYFGPDGSRR